MHLYVPILILGVLATIFVAGTLVTSAQLVRGAAA